MHRRTTLILDDDLVAKARGVTGVQEKTALVHEGLRALVARESARKLSLELSPIASALLFAELVSRRLA